MWAGTLTPSCRTTYRAVNAGVIRRDFLRRIAQLARILPLQVNARTEQHVKVKYKSFEQVCVELRAQGVVVHPTARPIDRLAMPSAANGTIRARCRSRCSVFVERAKLSSSVRSSGDPATTRWRTWCGD